MIATYVLPCGVSILSQFISDPAINRHHPSSLRVRSAQVRDFLNSSCPTSPFNQVAELTPLAGATRNSALSIHRPVSTVFLVRRSERPIIEPGRRRAWPNVTNAATGKLRTGLTIRHLHQCSVGYNCRSQTAAAMSAEHHECHSFLPQQNCSQFGWLTKRRNPATPLTVRDGRGIELRRAV